MRERVVVDERGLTIVERLGLRVVDRLRIHLVLERRIDARRQRAASAQGELVLDTGAPRGFRRKRRLHVQRHLAAPTSHHGAVRHGGRRVACTGSRATRP